MQQHTCQQCNSEFETTRKDAKFCSPTCRHKYWQESSNSVVIEYNTTEEIKEGIDQAKVQFSKLQNHFARLMNMYGDLEDILVRLDNRLIELEADVPKSKLQKLRDENETLKRDIKNLEEIEAELNRELKKCKKQENYDAWNDLSELFGDKN